MKKLVFKINKLKSIVNKFRLEDRIFIYILLFTMFTSVFLIIENMIIDYPMVANIKWIITFILSFWFFNLMIKQKCVKWIQFIYLSFLIIVILPMGWLNSSVHNPFTIAYSFLFCIAIVFFLEGIAQTVMLILLVLVVGIMTILTFKRPDLFMVVDTSIQYIDSMTQILITFIVAVVMLRTFSKANRNNLLLLEKKNKDLIYVTLHDELTGVYNRRYIFQHLNAMKQSSDTKEILIGMIDIDDFKRINDTFGHEEGDTLLKESAKFIQEKLKDIGFVGRYGGDEFFVIIEDKDITVQKAFFNAMKVYSESMHQQNNKASFSGGFVHCYTNENLNSCLARADKYLYAAKEAGKNRFCIEGEIL